MPGESDYFFPSSGNQSDYFFLNPADYELNKQRDATGPISFFPSVEGADGSGYGPIPATSKYTKRPVVSVKPISRSEQTTITKAQEDEGFATDKDINFWRNEPEYVEWLYKRGLNASSLPSWQGSRMFLDYIRDKANNPEGFGAMGHNVARGVGTLVNEISGTIDQIPVVRELASAGGSVFKFFGNLLDSLRNVSAGVTTALFSGHVGEVPGNVANALAHGLTAGTQGTYFSFADFKLRNLLDKAKKGMSDKKFYEYIESQDYQQIKRSWQTAGLVADMVFDPIWLLGLGISKGTKFFKGMRSSLADYMQLSGRFNAFEDAATAKRLAGANGVFLEKSDDFLRHLNKDVAAAESFGTTVSKVKEGLSLTKKVRKTGEGLDELALYMRNLVSDYGIEATRNPAIQYQQGLELRLYKPFRRLRQLSGGDEILWSSTVPAKKLFDKVSEITGLGKTAALKKLRFGGLEKWQTRLSEGIQGGVESKYLRKHGVHEFTESYVNAVDDISEYLKKNADVVPEGYDAAEILQSVVENKTGTEFASMGIKLPGEIATSEVITNRFHRLNELGEIETVGSKAGLDNVINGRLNIIAKEMKALKGIESVDLFIDDWKKLSRSLLADDRNARLAVTNYLTKKGLARWTKSGKGGKKQLELFLDDNKTRKLLGDTLYGEEFVHQTLDYAPRNITKEWREAMSKSESPSAGGTGKGFSALYYDPSRIAYLPKHFDNPEFMRKFWGKEQSAEIIAKLKNGSMTETDLWFDSVDRLWSKMYNPKEAALVQDLYKTGMIDQYPVHILNTLSQNGWLRRGVREKIYETSHMSFLERIRRSASLQGQVEGLIGVHEMGKGAGWIKPLSKLSSDGTVRKINPPSGKYLGQWDWVPGAGIFSNYYVPEFMSGKLKGFSEGLIRMFNPMEHNLYGGAQQIPLLKTLSNIHNWWRVQVTMKNIPFHSRNAITNGIMSLSEGRPLFPFDKTQKEAWQLWMYGHLLGKKGREGKAFKFQSKLDDLAKVKLQFGGQTMDVPEWFAAFVEGKVMGNNQMHEVNSLAKNISGYVTPLQEMKVAKELDSIAQRMWGSKFNLFGTEDVLSQAGSLASSVVEDGLARIPMMIHYLKKRDMTFSEAAQRVNHIFVDYGNLSRGEKALRAYLIPFYTWQSRMIGVMMGKMGTNPAMFTKLIQFQENMNKMLELDKRFASDLEEDTEGIPMLTSFDDVKKFFGGRPLSEIQPKFLAAERFVPQGVINLIDVRTPLDFLNPAKYWNGISKKILSDMSPVIKTSLIEVPLNIDTRTGRQFDNYYGDTRRLLGFLDLKKRDRQMLLSVTGLIRQVDDVVNLFQKNQYTGKTTEVTDFVIKNIIGMKAYERNEVREVTRLKHTLEDAYRGNIRDAKAKKYSDRAVTSHYKKALSLRYALDVIKWYEEYLLEHRDKAGFDKLSEERKQALAMKEWKKTQKKKPVQFPIYY